MLFHRQIPVSIISVISLCLNIAAFICVNLWLNSYVSPIYLKLSRDGRENGAFLFIFFCEKENNPKKLPGVTWPLQAALLLLASGGHCETSFKLRQPQLPIA